MIDEEITFFSDWAKMRDCPQDTDGIEVGSLSLRLRRMLIDQHRLMDTVKRKHRIKTRFPLPTASTIWFSDRSMLFEFPRDIFSNASVLSSSQNAFLNSKIVEIDGTPLSISQVIKIVANNLGGVHYDYDAAKREFRLNFESEVNVRVLRMAICSIAKATSAALCELAQLCYPFPDDSLLGHYTPSSDSTYSLIFESGQFLETPYPENTVTSYLSIFSVIEPLPQIHSRSYLYSFEFRDGAFFDISIGAFGDFWACYSKGMAKLEVLHEDNKIVRPIGKQILLSASIEKNGLNTILSIGVNGRRKEMSFEYPISKIDLKSCASGAGNEKRYGAAFMEKEIVILKRKDSLAQETLFKYFTYRYL